MTLITIKKRSEFIKSNKFSKKIYTPNFIIQKLKTNKTDKIPSDNEKKKYSWQKKHVENRTGTKDSYKPTKIKKNSIKKKYEAWK